MSSALNPARLRRVLAFSTAEGGTATVIQSLLGGTFLTAFALFLGASAWQVGLLASLGPAMQVGQVFTAYIVERVESRRRLTTWTLVIFRVLWSVAGLVALVLPKGWNLPVFMFLYAAAWLFAAPGVNAWQSLMTDIVPIKIRGRYFGRRWMINTGIGMGAIMLAGWMVDHYPGGTGFAVLYGLGLLVSFLNWYQVAELPELPNLARHQISYWEHLKKPLRNSPFRITVMWLGGWTFLQLALPPFYTVLMAERLGLSYSVISILTAVMSLASAASFPLWGRWIDRRGPLRLVGPAAATSAVVPLLWLLAGQVGTWYLFPLHALLGVVIAGLQTLTLQTNMRLAPHDERAIHLAIMNGANGLAGFAGPVMAGLLAEAGRFDLMFGLAGLMGLGLAALWRFRLQAQVANA